MKARKILSVIMAIAIIVMFAVSASAAEDSTVSSSLSYEDFNGIIRSVEGGVYDGENITVVLKDSERSYQNNKTAQFFIGATDVNITEPVEAVSVSNVNFVFEDDDTANTYTSGELQVFANVIEFTGCTFEGVAVSPWGRSNADNAESATFTGCKWENLSGRYGVHQNRASALTVTGCTFENCERGIHTNSSTVTSIVITNNTFTGIGDGYGVICLAESNGDLSQATLNISNNTAEGQVMLRQLSNTVTYEQVSAILDAGNNTYGTAYVTGSVEPAPAATPVAKIGNTEYTDLQAAINDAIDGDTITLLRNIEQTDGVTITDKKLTLDLAKYTFTVTEGSSTNSRNFLINGSSVVTIKNGTLVGAGDINSGTYGTIRTEGTANVTLTGLKLYNYRGNGLNIKALTGTTVNISDTEIYSTYGGGIEAAGAEMELTNVTVEQKGMWTAPYNSMAISVNGGGTVIVNSGSYTTEPLAAEDAYSQGSSHGSWAAGVLNSGGTLIIKGGTFRNGNFGDDSLATAARGLILADTGANIQIEGGTFEALKSVIDIQNNLGDASKNPTGTIVGGTFSADPTNNYVKISDGYTLTENANGTYGVVKEAEIDPAFGTTLGVARIGANEEDYELVLLGAIDSLNYKDVGFEITFNDKVHELKTKTVYTKVTSTNADTEEVEDYTSKVLGGAENGYVFGQMLGFALEDTDKEFTCRLFAINLNDEYVFGKTWTVPVVE